MFERWLSGALGARGPLGSRGERLAERYLRRLGYRILARNLRTQLGELDLVAEEGGVLVFIEVKTRTSADKGQPWEAVHHSKQRRMTRLAVGYLKQHDLLDRPARFDVVAITWPSEWWRPPTLEHFRDAFPAAGPWG